MIKLLHVEDDADIREITKLSLELTGEFELAQFSNGEDALARLETFVPDAILLDMMMPVMTGEQLLAHIRQKPHLSRIPAIFMTARAQTAQTDQMRAAGAVDVIIKPFDPMSLGSKIKEILHCP